MTKSRNPNFSYIHTWTMSIDPGGEQTKVSHTKKLYKQKVTSRLKLQYLIHYFIKIYVVKQWFLTLIFYGNFTKSMLISDFVYFRRILSKRWIFDQNRNQNKIAYFIQLFYFHSIKQPIQCFLTWGKLPFLGNLGIRKG